MAIERISEIQGLPVVGRCYLVLCVKARFHGVNRWWPVLGPLHEDRQYIGFQHEHYHYDFRFISDRAWRSRLVGRINARSMGDVLIVGRADEWPSCLHALSGVAELKRKCVRQTMEFPNVLCKVLEPVYRNQTLNCLRCPHKGIPLTGIPSDDQGNVVCPGHGLAWNLETGKLVSRLAGRS